MFAPATQLSLMRLMCRQKSRGVSQPFIAVDLRRFLPPWAAQGEAAFEDEPTGFARDLAQDNARKAY